MKLFVDTGDLDEIREAVSWGIIDGVTCNPTAAAKTGMHPTELYPKICELMRGRHVSLETVGETADEIVEQARVLTSISDDVVVKIPNTKEGLKAVQRLNEEGIRSNVTVTFSAIQAMLAAKAGAAFVSPFVGRLDRIGHRGLEVVEQTLQIYRNFGVNTEIITASVHSPETVLEAGLIGSHICTMPFDVLTKLFNHPLTDIGIQKFLNDWEKVPGKEELWSSKREMAQAGT